MLIINLLRIDLSQDNEILTQVAPFAGVSFDIRNIVIHTMDSLKKINFLIFFLKNFLYTKKIVKKLGFHEYP